MHTKSTQDEFYRDLGLEMETSDFELHLLTQMPREDFIWYCNILVTIGDIMIATGTHLKESVRPSTKLSREVQ